MITADSKPLLSVENLSAHINSQKGLVRAVDGVSFTINHGATLGLVGESGCGKTMVARALMGLLPKHTNIGKSSRVKFHGKDLLILPEKQLRQIIGKDIAIIFQDPLSSLNPVIKIGQQITEVLIYHLKMDQQSARKQAIELLQMVGVPIANQRFGQYPHHLSGGLRQRVAIAVALACKPQLLIADEPTTALDVTIQAEMLDLIDNLRRDYQMATLLISHDLDLVAGRTDTTMVMYAGKIVECAPTSKLFAKTRMPYTRALKLAVPRLSDAPQTVLQAIEGQPPGLMDQHKGCQFAPRCTYARSKCHEKSPHLHSVDDPEHWYACWYPLETKRL